MGQKIKTFKENTRLVRAVASLLEEGAIEVRNQAKASVTVIRQNMTQREFDSLLLKSSLSERQQGLAKKIAEQ